MMDLFVMHNSYDLFFREPFGAVPCGQTVTLRLKITGAQLLRSVLLRLWENGQEKIVVMVPMEKGEGDVPYDSLVFQACIKAPEQPGWLWYYFILKGEGWTGYYGSPGSMGGIGQMAESPPDSYQITVYQKDYHTPDWIKDGIMYQIFVDRFYNGNENGAVYPARRDYVIHKDWDELPHYKPDPVVGDLVCNDFFGGNLLGIIKKLPYLKELGITVLYLNPIFEAYSNHKYDTADYLHIDPMFGDNETFRLLCRKAEEAGISIILDGVFSHTGSDSIYFNKEGRYPGLGAYQSVHSPYYPWYRFTRHPDLYECWWGIHTLPNVEEMEPSYQHFMIKSPDSVARFWIRMGAKGWRLDVADELPDSFIKSFREAVKDEKEDAVIIGEVWEDASNKISYGKMREYLLGYELDSTMNYPFRTGLLHFLLGEWDAWDLYKSFMSLYEHYPLQSFYALMNIIGTHDVARIKNILAETPPADSLTRDEQAHYCFTQEQEELAGKRIRLASLIQFSFPGVPCIYYGDEAGMSGYYDPLNRGTYPWGREDMELLSWYKTIIGLRHKIDALRTGDLKMMAFHKDVFGVLRYIENRTDVFGRRRENGTVLVLINRSRSRSYSLNIELGAWSPAQYIDGLTGERIWTKQDGKVQLEICPLEPLVLVGKE